jgi:succinate dehydrogenase/fumarate reductase flavoprotein subunit
MKQQEPKRRREPESGVSRRQFIGGAGVALAGAMSGLALTACADQASATPGVVPYHESIRWDAEYDAVIVGFGLAGASAAVAADEAGAGKLLIVEKAPYGEEGGNSKVCEQYCLLWDDEESGVKYMTGMSEKFASASPEVIRFMAKGGMENKAWLAGLGVGELTMILDQKRVLSWKAIAGGSRGEIGAIDYEIGEWVVFRDDGSVAFGEYPVLPNGEWNTFAYWSGLGGPDHEEKRLWKAMRKQVVDHAENIDVWLESPAVALIQDPVSKTIFGVQVNRKGETVNVRALNGVALTCGSYEANREMVETFAQRAETYPVGPLHNTGDGLVMGMAAGAEMWHMNALSGPWLLPKMPTIDRCYFLGTMRNRWLQGRECIHVDSRGKRFEAEHGWHKHGHMRVGDTMQNQQHPHQAWAIFNEEADQDASVEKIDASLVFSAESPEKLAELIGLDPAALAKTVSDYNGYCATGIDREYNRDARTMQALDASRLRAVRLYSCIVNAQAGPRRNTSCEVVDTKGNPIPGLYSAGELGSFWAGAYECGGNVAECLYTGRTAGEQLVTRTELPEAVTYTKIESSPALTGNDILEVEEGGSDVTLGANEYLGVAEGMHGSVKVKVKYVNGTIENVEVIEQYETPELTEKVWSDMPAAMVAANSVEVDTIGGATVSSHALIAAVTDAIAQA